MNAASLARFSAASAASAQSLRPGTVTIGDETYDAAVFLGNTTGINEEGGEMTVRTIIAHISRDLLVTAPASGIRILHVESGRTGEIYKIGGEGLPYHIIHASSFPGK